jgi:uncharacterized protein (TIGR02118 family)
MNVPGGWQAGGAGDVGEHSIVFVTRRLPHLTHEEFVRHYEEVHAPLAQQLPGLVEYRQMPIRADYEWNGQQTRFDAVSVYVFESDEAATAAWASPEGVAVNEDTVIFMEWESILAFPGHSFQSYGPATASRVDRA